MKKIGFKYEIIAKDVERMIENGGFPNGKLPSETALMEKYEVGKVTVYKALSLLVDKGVLVRVKGSGTFIKGCEPGNRSQRLTATNVLVVMHTTGHVFSEFFDALRRELSNAGLTTLSTDIDLATCDAERKKHLAAILNSGIRGVIIYGDAYWKNPVLRGHSDMPAVFVGHFDHDGQPPNGMGVFFDYEAGAYMAAKHLLEQGRRNLILFRHDWRHTIKITESHRANHPIHQMDVGFNKALAEFNDAVGGICSVADERTGLDLQIRGLLAPGADRPDGVVCMADNLARGIVSSAEEMGVSIPGELAVAGYYDTPWSRGFRTRITSVSVGLEETAAQAVAMLLDPDTHQGPIKIQPKLIVRESTSGKKESIRSTTTLPLERVV
jgi:GntR family transcriptional regulator of arabinose operon